MYGAGGGIGGGVARTFAREGATVFLAGRAAEPLEAVAAGIRSAGGSAEVTVLDATDDRAVDAHVEAVVAQAGSVDVSFNLISRGDVQRIPLVDMTTEQLLRAVVTGPQSNFVTARAAARRMIERGSGGILHLNPRCLLYWALRPDGSCGQLHPLVVPQDSQTKHDPAGRMRTPQVEQ